MTCWLLLNSLPDRIQCIKANYFNRHAIVRVQAKQDVYILDAAISMFHYTVRDDEI